VSSRALSDALAPIDDSSAPSVALSHRTHDPGAVDAREHALVAQPLDRVRRALARVLGAGIDDVADLLEDVDEHVLLERRERRPIAPVASVRVRLFRSK